MEEEREDLDIYVLQIVDVMSGDRQGVKCDKFWKMEFVDRGIPGKRDDKPSKKRRLYVKKVDQ
jgi:hypothetical protein